MNLFIFFPPRYYYCIFGMASRRIIYFFRVNTVLGSVCRWRLSLCRALCTSRLRKSIDNLVIYRWTFVFVGVSVCEHRFYRHRMLHVKRYHCRRRFIEFSLPKQKVINEIIEMLCESPWSNTAFEFSYDDGLVCQAYKNEIQIIIVTRCLCMIATHCVAATHQSTPCRDCGLFIVTLLMPREVQNEFLLLRVSIFH